RRARRDADPLRPRRPTRGVFRGARLRDRRHVPRRALRLLPPPRQPLARLTGNLSHPLVACRQVPGVPLLGGQPGPDGTPGTLSGPASLRGIVSGGEMQSVKAGAGPTDRAIVPQPLRVDFVRPLARTLAIAAAALAVVDFVAGSVLYVTDGAIPRVIWAAAYALWAYREWRRPRPALLALLVTAAATTAVLSLLTVVWDLPFDWYDQYTAYGILL